MIGSNSKRSLQLFNDTIGEYLNLREIHFNTQIQAQHNLTNEIMPEFVDLADFIMEQTMGLFGRPGYDVINPIVPHEQDLTQSLKNYKALLLTFRASINNKDIFAGMLATVDDFLASLNRWIYLSINK